MTDKEQIICKYKFQDKEKFDGKPYCTCFNELCKNLSFVCDQNCIIYEDYKQLVRKTQECEELKKQLMQKSEVDMFFNTPIEGWSNDPCRICPHKAENEELKKEIINKNEKIKELRLSVSDLTNRLCYLNAEKSFRIVDLEQTLDEIEKELKERLVRTEEDLKYQCVDCMNVKSDRYRKALEEIEEHYEKVVKNLTTYDDSYDANISIEALHNISDIINKAKGEGKCQ